MADEEDIPANFPEEDDDLLENEPVCKHLLLFYTLEQKKKNSTQGVLSALSCTIDCMEMESATCADTPMESTNAGRCCTACLSISPYSGGEDHYQGSRKIENTE
jgi:hypothetical protein